jgi:hypothetical protein
MKQKYMIVAAWLLICSFIVIIKTEKPVRESIIFFPINHNIRFQTASTVLTLKEEKRNDYFQVVWKIMSKLQEDAYLRQDIGLLYENGRLKGKMNGWEQNTDRIVESMIVLGQESSLYQAISFHYAEIHDNQTDDITSAQTMTNDHLYVIDSNFSPLTSFREASNNLEEEWEHILDHVTKQQLQYTWTKGLQIFKINRNDYIEIPLTSLHTYEHEPFPSYSIEDTQIIIGNIWEGLYKNYFLGIKTKDDVVDPLNSIVPLILFPKKGNQLLILIVTGDQEPFLLKQQLPTSN